MLTRDQKALIAKMNESTMEAGRLRATFEGAAAIRDMYARGITEAQLAQVVGNPHNVRSADRVTEGNNVFFEVRYTTQFGVQVAKIQPGVMESTGQQILNEAKVAGQECVIEIKQPGLERVSKTSGGYGILTSEGVAPEMFHNSVHFANRYAQLAGCTIGEACKVYAALDDAYYSEIGGSTASIHEKITGALAEALQETQPGEGRISVIIKPKVTTKEGHRLFESLNKTLMEHGWGVRMINGREWQCSRMIVESDARKRAFKAGIPYPAQHFMAQSTDAVLQPHVGDAGSASGTTEVPKDNNPSILDMMKKPEETKVEEPKEDKPKNEQAGAEPIVESDARKRARKAGIPYPEEHFKAHSTDAVMAPKVGDDEDAALEEGKTKAGLPSAFWVNVETGDIEKTNGDSPEDDVYDDPKKFGVDAKDLLDRDDPAYDEDSNNSGEPASTAINAATENGKWVLCHEDYGILYVTAKDKAVAEKVLRQLDAKYNVEELAKKGIELWLSTGGVVKIKTDDLSGQLDAFEKHPLEEVRKIHLVHDKDDEIYKLLSEAQGDNPDAQLEKGDGPKKGDDDVILDPFRRKMQRELLKFAIQSSRTFMCEFSGKPLDVRKSVLITMKKDGKDLKDYLMDGEHWDKHKAGIMSKLAGKPGYEIEVIDGRVLNGGKKPKGGKPKGGSSKGKKVNDGQLDMFAKGKKVVAENLETPTGTKVPAGEYVIENNEGDTVVLVSEGAARSFVVLKETLITEAKAKAQPFPNSLEEYKKQFAETLKRIYLIEPNDIADDKQIEDAFNRKEGVEAFVRSLGDKYDLESSDDRKATWSEARWSGEVATSWTPPEGLFTKSAEEIARVVAAASKSLKQAVSKITFYLNRAGDKLSAEDRSRVSGALKIVRGIFGKKKHEVFGEALATFDDATDVNLRENTIFAFAENASAMVVVAIDEAGEPYVEQAAIVAGNQVFSDLELQAFGESTATGRQLANVIEQALDEAKKKAPSASTPLWKQEFPNFEDYPAEIDAFIKDGTLKDTSWHNDAMPSFEFGEEDPDSYGGQRFRLWVDYKDPKRRELGKYAKTRYFISKWITEKNGYEHYDDIAHSDDINEILKKVRELLAEEEAAKAKSSDKTEQPVEEGKKTEVADVYFRKHKDGTVVAVFPKWKYQDEPGYGTTIYTQADGWDGVDIEKLNKETTPASESEYGPVLKALNTDKPKGMQFQVTESLEEQPVVEQAGDCQKFSVEPRRLSSLTSASEFTRQLDKMHPGDAKTYSEAVLGLNWHEVTFEDGTKALAAEDPSDVIGENSMIADITESPVATIVKVDDVSKRWDVKGGFYRA